MCGIFLLKKQLLLPPIACRYVYQGRLQERRYQGNNMHHD